MKSKATFLVCGLLGLQTCEKKLPLFHLGWFITEGLKLQQPFATTHICSWLSIATYSGRACIFVVSPLHPLLLCGLGMTSQRNHRGHWVPWTYRSGMAQPWPEEAPGRQTLWVISPLGLIFLCPSLSPSLLWISSSGGFVNSRNLSPTSLLNCHTSWSCRCHSTAIGMHGWLQPTQVFTIKFWGPGV